MRRKIVTPNITPELLNSDSGKTLPAITKSIRGLATRIKNGVNRNCVHVGAMGWAVQTCRGLVGITRYVQHYGDVITPGFVVKLPSGQGIVALAVAAPNRLYCEATPDYLDLYNACCILWAALQETPEIYAGVDLKTLAESIR